MVTYLTFVPDSRRSLAFESRWGKRNLFVYIYRRYLINALLLYIEFMCVLLWAAAQRKRATMLYFANVLFIYLFIYFFLWPPYSPALVNGGSRKFYTW